MQIKQFDELELEFEQAGFNLDKIGSLISILLDCVLNGNDIKQRDIQNLMLVINEEVSILKEKFNLIESKLNF